jgi:hypothetical protein
VTPRVIPRHRCRPHDGTQTGSCGACSPAFFFDAVARRDQGREQSFGLARTPRPGLTQGPGIAPVLSRP